MTRLVGMLAACYGHAMANLQVKNVPDALHRRLQRTAQAPKADRARRRSWRRSRGSCHTKSSFHGSAGVPRSTSAVRRPICCARCVPSEPEREDRRRCVGGGGVLLLRETPLGRSLASRVDGAELLAPGADRRRSACGLTAGGQPVACSARRGLERRSDDVRDWPMRRLPTHLSCARRGRFAAMRDAERCAVRQRQRVSTMPPC